MKTTHESNGPATTNRYADVLLWAKELVRAEEASLKACAAMRNAPPGVSRARSTTLNAKWSAAAEHRDRIAHKLHVAVVRVGLAERFPDDYYGTFPSGHKWCQILIERERP
ncbi:hypothetical protein [Fimbriiglobus ruber]|uniref:hypothetical protein n=1 Tax=Fimbriiglobus ruber TaxID=1908690 RepID=UPI000B4C1EE4|nr:hypothetical protein [Fimbriiglobus ruber]